MRSFDLNPMYLPKEYHHPEDCQFIVENILEELDQPGEWCLDTEEGILYFWPLKDSIDNMEGVAPVPQIDITVKLGYGLQHGPFELADRVGLDKVQKWMDNLYYEYGLQKFKASPILKRLVRANYLGRKVGKGFYKYENGQIISHAISATEFK